MENTDTESHGSPPGPPDLVEQLRAVLREELRAERRRDAAPEPLLTKGDVAEVLGVTTRTVDTIAAAGELPKIKVRGCVRFAPAAVESYLRERAGEVER